MDCAITAEDVAWSFLFQKVYVLIEGARNVHIIVAHVHDIFAGSSFGECPEVLVIATVLFVFIVMDGIAIRLWLVLKSSTVSRTSRRLGALSSWIIISISFAYLVESIDSSSRLRSSGRL